MGSDAFRRVILFGEPEGKGKVEVAIEAQYGMRVTMKVSPDLALLSPIAAREIAKALEEAASILAAAARS